MPRAWNEKNKHPQESIVWDYGPSRNYMMMRFDGCKPVYDKPTESVEAIHNWTNERHDNEVQNFFDSDRGLTANLIERAAVSRNAIDCLEMKAGWLIDAIYRLAEQGSTHAIHSLVWVLQSRIWKMNQLARSKPELFRSVARKFWKWPMSKSTHPHLSESNDLLELIQLGKEVGFQVDRYSKWKPDKAMEIAFRLKSYLENIRNNVGQQYPVKWQKIFLKYSFNKDDAEKLWGFAKMSLLHSYPKPEMVKEFNEIGIRQSKTKNPSSRRTAILEKIHARFVHLFCQS